MDRVGKYLMVLLIIWIPNLLVNFYQEVYGSKHTKYEVLVEVLSFTSHSLMHTGLGDGTAHLIARIFECSCLLLGTQIFSKVGSILFQI